MAEAFEIMTGRAYQISEDLDFRPTIQSILDAYTKFSLMFAVQSQKRLCLLLGYSGPGATCYLFPDLPMMSLILLDYASKGTNGCI